MNREFESRGPKAVLLTDITCIVPQESLFWHMKDELAGEISSWTPFADAKASIDRWMDYYNDDRCQWDLAKPSPNEFSKYISTSEHSAGTLPQWVK